MKHTILQDKLDGEKRFLIVETGVLYIYKESTKVLELWINGDITSIKHGEGLFKQLSATAYGNAMGRALNPYE